MIAFLGLVMGLSACRQTIVEYQPLPGAIPARTGYADAITNIAPSVVCVHTRTELSPDSAVVLTNDPALRQLLDQKKDGSAPKHLPLALVGLGSGVVISRDGYVLTSGHVIESADQIVITTPEGDEFKARVVGIDAPTDIAVLKVQTKDLPAARLADSSRVRVGDVVLAIGNPFGVGQTVTSGIVSGTERDGFGIADYENFIQTDASINPGNSGGALVDADGRVIGISIAIVSSGGGFEGIGLAVPINLARTVMQQLIASGKVTRGYLGASLHPLTPALGKSIRAAVRKGAVVMDLAEGSPAARAGMEEGDVIIEFNGLPVENNRELRLRIAQTSPGTKVSFKVQRMNRQKVLRATLGEMPSAPIVRRGEGEIKEVSRS
ncbi:MAG TPA: trypsin-like peptidase domain-containing protein [Candidatus Limnocylindrales bacterium]|nr:trypsin-like peptidase domain-containing protein [Candidatus Limnocylindrales bacterium]